MIGVVLAAFVGSGTLAAAHGAAPAGSTTAPEPALRVVAGSAVTTVPRHPAVASVGADGVPVAVRQALTAAGGSVSVAVFDAASGRTWSADDRSGQVEASTSKLQILGAWLRDEQAGRTATARITTNLHAMVASSSNPAADALFTVVGRAGLTGFTSRLGVKVGAGSGRHFGLDTSSAADQVTIMRAFAYPNAVLTDRSRAEANGLLEQVEDAQRWGVSGGVPSSVDIDLKDGWLQFPSGWVVNSVGHVHGGGHDYVVAILSSGNATRQAGIDRLHAVSAAVWTTSATKPVASAAS